MHKTVLGHVGVQPAKKFVKKKKKAIVCDL